MLVTQHFHIPYLILMQWLLLTGLISFGTFMAWDTGLLPSMLANDNTRLSIIILTIFFAACLHCFERSLYLSRQFSILNHYTSLPDSTVLSTNSTNSPVQLYLIQASTREEQDTVLLSEVLAENIRGQNQIGWFISGVLIKLGLLGTVIGFMLMLGSLDNIQSMDIGQVQTLMQTMTQGMKIALNTTLLGLASSMLLGIQYLYLDRRADQLVAQTIQLSQTLLDASKANSAIADKSIKAEI